MDGATLDAINTSYATNYSHVTQEEIVSSMSLVSFPATFMYGSETRSLTKYPEIKLQSAQRAMKRHMVNISLLETK